jgi:ech hydrogenase subunit F
MIDPSWMPMVGRSLKNLVSRPATRLFPIEVRAPFRGARGHVEVDLATCLFCGLCARKCPSVALSVSKEKRTIVIEHLRCIACGVCVDACNQDSVRMEVAPIRVYTRAEGGPNGTWPKGREQLVGPPAPPRPAPAAPAQS